jgi:hypothetical protein
MRCSAFNLLISVASVKCGARRKATRRANCSCVGRGVPDSSSYHGTSRSRARQFTFTFWCVFDAVYCVPSAFHPMQTIQASVRVRAHGTAVLDLDLVRLVDVCTQSVGICRRRTTFFVVLPLAFHTTYIQVLNMSWSDSRIMSQCALRACHFRAAGVHSMNHTTTSPGWSQNGSPTKRHKPKPNKPFQCMLSRSSINQLIIRPTEVPTS